MVFALNKAISKLFWCEVVGRGGLLLATSACQNFCSLHARNTILHHITMLHVRPRALYFRMGMAVTVHVCPIPAVNVCKEAD